ncbi:hypothetical protein AB0M43_36205 [Longispora sp. NPDC051575]|uniref:hypothetical protein n=1 Tax=Longispora sp. NPDC051575 TaxID=3154943 RepID=UPI003449CCB7
MPDALFSEIKLINPDTQPGDRVTIFTGARHADTLARLTEPVQLDVTDVEAAPKPAIVRLTGQPCDRHTGHWTGEPTATFLAATKDLSVPVRVGDTVTPPEGPDVAALVLALPQRHLGNVEAVLLYPTGAVSTLRLHWVAHRDRARAPLPVQLCGYRHRAGVPCDWCAVAAWPVTTPCQDKGCLLSAATLVHWTDVQNTERAKALCPEHASIALQREGRQGLPLARGTHEVSATGTQTATCAHCGHPIHRALHRKGGPAWMASPDPTSAQCPATDGGGRHKPTVTVGPRNRAVTGARCGRADTGHLLADCPARTEERS